MNAACRFKFKGIAAGLALAAAGAFTMRAEARTVRVAEQTESAVTLAFGEPDALDYGLFLAHGVTDGGDEKGAWDSFEKVADASFSSSFAVHRGWHSFSQPHMAAGMLSIKIHSRIQLFFRSKTSHSPRCSLII